jgi:hypothetical protein
MSGIGYHRHPSIQVASDFYNSIQKDEENLWTKNYNWPSSTNCNECRPENCGIWKDIPVLPDLPDTPYINVPHLICPCFNCASNSNFKWGSYKRNVDLPSHYEWNWEPIPCNGSTISNGGDKEELSNHDLIFKIYYEYYIHTPWKLDEDFHGPRILHLMQNGYETPFCTIDSIIDILSEVYNAITPANEFIRPRNDLISYFNWLISDWENKLNILLYEQIQNISELTSAQRDEQMNIFKTSYIDIEGKNNTMDNYYEYHLNCLRSEEAEDIEHDENLENIMISVAEMFDDIEEYDEPPDGEGNLLDENGILILSPETIVDNNYINDENIEIIENNENNENNEDYILHRILFDNIPNIPNIPIVPDNDINDVNFRNNTIRETCRRGINILDSMLDIENPENAYLSDENYRQLMNIFQEIHNMNA